MSEINYKKAKELKDLYYSAKPEEKEVILLAIAAGMVSKHTLVPATQEEQVRQRTAINYFINDLKEQFIVDGVVVRNNIIRMQKFMREKTFNFYGDSFLDVTGMSEVITLDDIKLIDKHIQLFNKVSNLTKRFYKWDSQDECVSGPTTL